MWVFTIHRELSICVLSLFWSLFSVKSKDFNIPSTLIFLNLRFIHFPDLQRTSKRNTLQNDGYRQPSPVPQGPFTVILPPPPPVAPSTTAPPPPPPQSSAVINLPLSEVMRRSPPRSLRYSTGWKYDRISTGKPSSLPAARRSPSPVCSPLELFISGDHRAASRKRPRTTNTIPVQMLPVGSLRRSITPASVGGRRSETPLSASHRIPPPTADSPQPCALLSARLPTARVLFGEPPTSAETSDFFTQVERQLQEELGGMWPGLPQSQELKMPPALPLSKSDTI